MEALLLSAVGIALLVSGIANDPRVAWPYWVVWAGTVIGYMYVKALSLRVLRWLTLISLLVIVGIGLVQSATSLHGRPSSIVNSSVIFGHISLWATILAASMGLRAILPVTVAGLLISLSRSALLGLMLAIALYVWYTLPARRWIVLVIVLISIVGYQISLSLGRSGLSMRVAIWVSAMRVGGGLVGNGPGYLKSQLPLNNPYCDAVWHAHNILLQAWGDLGIMGLVLIAICVYLVGRGKRTVWAVCYCAALLPSLLLDYILWLPGLAVLVLSLYRCMAESESQSWAGGHDHGPLSAMHPEFPLRPTRAITKSTPER